jgi:hypothetical protein
VLQQLRAQHLSMSEAEAAALCEREIDSLARFWPGKSGPDDVQL